ncbi:MAG: hypothetical protein ACI84D_002890, partial [Thalassolituus oleivorans]
MTRMRKVNIAEATPRKLLPKTTAACAPAPAAPTVWAIVFLYHASGCYPHVPILGEGGVHDRVQDRITELLPPGRHWRHFGPRDAVVE